MEASSKPKPPSAHKDKEQKIQWYVWILKYFLKYSQDAEQGTHDHPPSLQEKRKLLTYA